VDLILNMDPLDSTAKPDGELDTAPTMDDTLDDVELVMSSPHSYHTRLLSKSKRLQTDAITVESEGTKSGSLNGK
jgi:hypothetical protein